METLGTDITPEKLASASADRLEKLRLEFGNYFEQLAAQIKNIKLAISKILWHWPVCSVDNE